jgi:hypothetical protein
MTRLEGGRQPFGAAMPRIDAALQPVVAEIADPTDADT